MNNLELNKLYNGDCIELLNYIPDNSVNLLFTDPPYNISIENNIKTMKDRKGRNGLDFGEWDKNFNQELWLNIALKKVVTGGSVIIFNDWKNIGLIKGVLENNGFTLKQLIQWKKTNPMPRNRDRLYVTSSEYAIWAVKGKGWTFNRQRSNYENAIFEYPTVSNKKRIHPTQKNENLITELLNIHTNESDIVLDCFSGSGVIPLCCLKNKRNFYAIEKDYNYYKLSNEILLQYKKE